MTLRAQAYQKRLHALGLCPHCRQEITDINPKTGKKYTFCPVERERRRLGTQTYHAKKRLSKKRE